MFAVIRTGGKQYRVAPNDIIEIEKIAGNPGDIVSLGEVLLLGGDGAPKTGSPISGASVAAEVLEQKRDDKIIVFKKKRRQGYRRTKGHRQALTALRITEILTDGKKPSKATAKPAPKTTETKAAEKPADKKAAAKPAAKKAEAKPAAKTAETKAPAKKAPAKKTAAKAPAKKAAAKKTAAKAPAKKAAAKKAPAKKAPAKKKS
jgi:large subunit ribosomal protein L21